jgi:hypothetical protein
MRNGKNGLGSVLLCVLALGMVATPRPVSAQDATQTSSTYRVILFLSENGAPPDVEIRRLKEVWSEGDGAERLRSLLAAGDIKRLDAVTILPGQDTPAIQVGGVTVRVHGVLKEPRKDTMFLRVEVDGGREALVKEMISGFDETIVLAYPLTEGNRSIVALIVPAQIGN